MELKLEMKFINLTFTTSFQDGNALTFKSSNMTISTTPGYC